jgi:hypothetical protein
MLSCVPSIKSTKRYHGTSDGPHTACSFDSVDPRRSHQDCDVDEVALREVKREERKEVDRWDFLQEFLLTR